MIEPLRFHPKVRAALLQLARRIRHEGCKLRSELDLAEAVTAFAVVMPAAELLQLWQRERQAAFEWCAYAATVLEAGAGWAVGERTLIP